VLDGLFGLCQRLFGVVIKPSAQVGPPSSSIEGQARHASLWHDDVRHFEVSDAGTGAPLASFFLDPFSRPETKRGGAWMAVCLGKSRAVAGRELPVAHLVCNGSPPVGDLPSLMTFNQARRDERGRRARRRAQENSDHLY